MIHRRSLLAAVLALLVCISIPVSFTAFAAESATSSKEALQKVDLNSATADQLQQLPGIGPANAKKIIDNRPYKSVSDLSKAGIPASTIDKISGQVMVKPSAARSGTKPLPTSASDRKTPSETAKPRSEQAGKAATSDKVWLNTDSNVYHKSDSRFYGKTKSGKFVTEQEAIAVGAREGKE